MQLRQDFSREHGPVTSELLVRVATLFNDFNPAHYDATFAASIGLPGVIGPGTLLQAWMLADLRPVVGGSPVPVASIDLRLRQPFLIGDTVTITYRPSEGAIDVEAAARREPGDEPRVVATAKVTTTAAGDPA
jgi:acyl dehydratase